ncbi:MAG: bifunctional 5,10-methylenetetrahydrofolate dehydrogenase/5,10-methenyltetrahydrofolate cyclohydrolase [Parcubacteria group bacterium]|jgi:methylenetetrahydrofolate dehydrogenase (NADP+)/methenyltetrahydrofolate cyclohydrolase
MKLLRGKKIADRILAEIKTDIRKKKLKPILAVVLVGEDKASQIYVTLKGKAAKKVGIGFQLHKFSENSAETEIIKKIKMLNADREVDGIIVQLPLPKKMNTQKIINALDPQKDVDGFSPKSTSHPVFPKAILKVLESVETRFIVSKKSSIVIANSNKFGQTMVAALQQEKIKGEYILAGSLQKNIKKIQKADIIISAMGKPGLIKGNMLKKGAIIIDGGITKIGKKVLGDVDMESVKKVAAFVTPVPGGVGPVTIACLLENVYLAAKKQA